MDLIGASRQQGEENLVTRGGALRDFATPIGDCRRESVGRDRQQHIGGELFAVMHGVVGDFPLRFVPIVAARVQVSIEARKRGAGYLESNSMAGREPVARGIQVNIDLVDVARLHQNWPVEGFAKPNAEYPVDHVNGTAVRMHVK